MSMWGKRVDAWFTADGKAARFLVTGALLIAGILLLDWLLGFD